MLKIKRKAVSPVIATVLLIVVAIALFMIIFFWLKGFQKETIMKRGTSIENVCSGIGFNARICYTNKLCIRNTGNVPIQAFKKVLNNGDVEETQSSSPLMPGENLTISSCSNITKIIPVLRGQTSSGEKNYVCEAQQKPVSC